MRRFPVGESLAGQPGKIQNDDPSHPAPDRDGMDIVRWIAGRPAPISHDRFQRQHRPLVDFLR